MRCGLLYWAERAEKTTKPLIPTACDENKWTRAIAAATRVGQYSEAKQAAAEAVPVGGPYFCAETATVLVDIVRHATKYNQPLVVPGTVDCLSVFTLFR